MDVSIGTLVRWIDALDDCITYEYKHIDDTIRSIQQEMNDIISIE